ncbi:MAG: response regulator [Pseudomonadota bacterium]
MTQEIIIVEHEEKITQVLDDYPRQAVFSTHWLADGTEAEQIIRARSPTLVILDLMLLGRDGMSICQALRSDSDLPIIMLTARIDEIDRLLGLQAGADDHVCKPFSPRKVVARVHTILRRTNAAGAVKPNNKQMTYRQLRLDAAARTAQIGDRALKLTPVEFALLQTLLQQPGRVYARDDLMARAYSDNRVAAPRTIDSHMKNLRAKVLAVDPDADLIHSIYAVGYKLE